MCARMHVCVCVCVRVCVRVCVSKKRENSAWVRKKEEGLVRQEGELALFQGHKSLVWLVHF